MDVLDFIINVLREHEKTLDGLIERLESLEPEIWILEEKREIVQAYVLTLTIAFNILENRDFRNPFFSYESKPNLYGENILRDHINKRTLVFGESPSNPSRWDVRVFHGTENYGEQLQSRHFYSERKMLVWIIKYILRELNALNELLESLS
jgi:hypothetical protein